ncbi:MAG: hypothetical protein LC803_15575 [Acidobacteria bacterium]|nr:hypothetical protein [Acidobacteriota bacterium]
MRKDNSTRTPHARRQREPDFDEPLRRWSTLPVSQERASELVDAFTRYDDGDMIDALIQLVCGLAPHPRPTSKGTWTRGVWPGRPRSHEPSPIRVGRTTNSAHTLSN